MSDGLRREYLPVRSLRVCDLFDEVETARKVEVEIARLLDVRAVCDRLGERLLKIATEMVEAAEAKGDSALELIMRPMTNIHKCSTSASALVLECGILIRELLDAIKRSAACTAVLDVAKGVDRVIVKFNCMYADYKREATACTPTASMVFF